MNLSSFLPFSSFFIMSLPNWLRRWKIGKYFRTCCRSFWREITRHQFLGLVVLYFLWQWNELKKIIIIKKSIFFQISTNYIDADNFNIFFNPPNPIVCDVSSCTMVLDKFCCGSLFKSRDSEMSVIWLYRTCPGFSSYFCLILDKIHNKFR